MNFKVEDNKIILTVPVKEIKKNTKKKLEDFLNNCPIVVNPVELRTQAQNSLIHVLIEQYAYELGWITSELKKHFKTEFSKATGIEDFETSKTDIKTANQFISFIIDHALSNNINLYIYNKHDKTFKNLLEIDEVANRYIIACLKSKKCVICNSPADLEHWKTISATKGTYKNDDGLDGLFLPLCREHHSEKHNIGVKSFGAKYLIQGVKLDEKMVFELLDIYPNQFKLFRKNLKEGKYGNLERHKKF